MVRQRQEGGATRLTELGHFALILALTIAAAQMIVPAWVRASAIRA